MLNMDVGGFVNNTSSYRVGLKLMSALDVTPIIYDLFMSTTREEIQPFVLVHLVLNHKKRTKISAISDEQSSILEPVALSSS